MSITNPKPRRKYNCKQAELYAICTIGWNSYLENVTAFTALKPFYDTAFGNTKLAQVQAAMDIPSLQQRNSLSETDRLLLLQLKENCLIKWQDLKRYITQAFDKSMQKPMLEEAGSQLYAHAYRNNWEMVTMLMQMGSQFISAHATQLGNNNNMPPGFPAEFENARQEFLTRYDSFMDYRQNAEETTEEKINANNAIFDDLMKMFKDATHIFRRQPSLRERFIYEQVKTLVSGQTGSGNNNEEPTPGQVTLQGFVRNSQNNSPIPVAVIQVGTHTTTSNPDGSYLLKFVPVEANHNVTIIANSFQTINTTITLQPGQTITQDILMTPNSVPPPPSGTLQGQTTRMSDGMPVANALVEILGTPYTTTTDINGNFSIVGVPIGTYNVQFSAPGYATQSVQVTIAQSNPTIINIALM